ncbi:MAG TPA: hypothetical protein VF762_21505, partial [Blastocatellia bacterium]
MLIRKTALFTLVIALLTASASSVIDLAGADGAPSGGALVAADAAVSAERIARHVQFLASDKLQGRRAGTAAADEAANYIAKEFSGY